MTRREILALVSGFRNARDRLTNPEQLTGYVRAVCMVALAVRNVNPAFDVDRFMRDCYVKRD